MPDGLTLQHVSSRIFTLRGVQVMLDKDLAHFYEVKPIRLREQVKRNASRFPDDFMFQLNDDEVDYMVSQSAIPSRQHLGGAMPYAFTEQGVAALSAVLKSDRAVEVGIGIARAFVAMRKLLINHAHVFERLRTIELKQLEADRNFEKIFDALESPDHARPRVGIFYDGQIFDAYAFVAHLVKSARRSIILIDNYVDESVMVLLSKRSPSTTAIVYTRRISQQLELDLQKHNSQYPPLDIRVITSCHDRFLIIDDEIVYHIGASLKDLGKQCFAFSRMDSLADLIRTQLIPTHS